MSPTHPPPPIDPPGVAPATPRVGWRWIDQATLLADAAAAWAERPWIGLDTEFVRERTFFARPGLLQVAAGDHVDLVDLVALRGEDLEPVRRILADRRVGKVIHSASEDVEVLLRAVGVAPEPLLDTQIAATLAGFRPPPGYQRLVLELLQRTVTKEETRTDWTRRPLSAAQVAYAAEDVAHLVPTMERLRERLDPLDRWSWVLEDSAALTAAARREEPPEEAWRRVRAAERMTPRQLAALRGLAAWREIEARRRDLPRRFVLKDELLAALPVKAPRTLAEVRALRDYDARQGERDAETWLEIVRREMDRPPAEWPAAPAAPSEEEQKLEGSLRDAARAAADRLELAPETLAPRRAIQAVMRARGDVERALDLLGPWRRRTLEGAWRPLLVGSRPRAAARDAETGSRPAPGSSPEPAEPRPR